MKSKTNFSKSSKSSTKLMVSNIITSSNKKLPISTIYLKVLSKYGYNGNTPIKTIFSSKSGIPTYRTVAETVNQFYRTSNTKY